MAARGVRFFPGTTIPRMSTQAGINARVIGSREIKNALNRKLLAIKGGTLAGLLKVGMFIRKDMDTTPPLIPVDTGALRAAFKINMKPDYRIDSKGNKIDAVELGWPDVTINRDNKTVDQYAAYVHEMTIPPYDNVNWSRPGSGPKFFEYALKRNSKVIVEIIKQSIGPTI